MLHRILVSATVLALPLSAIAATPGARPGDDAMTCAMIGREMQPGAMAVANSSAPERERITKQVSKRSKEGKVEYARRSAEAAGCLPAVIATMGAVNPCDAINAAEDAASAAREPRRAVEDKAMMGDVDTMMANMNRSMAGLDMVRMKRLMALAEAKNCSEQ